MPQYAATLPYAGKNVTSYLSSLIQHYQCIHHFFTSYKIIKIKESFLL